MDTPRTFCFKHCDGKSEVLEAGGRRLQKEHQPVEPLGLNVASVSHLTRLPDLKFLIHHFHVEEGWWSPSSLSHCIVLSYKCKHRKGKPRIKGFNGFKMQFISMKTSCLLKHHVNEFIGHCMGYSLLFSVSIVVIYYMQNKCIIYLIIINVLYIITSLEK